jgi:ABC-type uncharacterized transport system involved in gliding motility auxiliary subunit
MNVKQLKILVWLSPMLIVAGLTAGVVAGAWGPVPLALILVGLAIAIAWLIAEGRGGFWQRRSTQASTNGLVATVAVVVILGLVNFLGVRYSQTIDLTENQLFTLAPQSQQVVQNLDEPVRLLIFAPTPNPEEERLLNNYRRLSDRFSYEFIDPQANPVKAQQFGVRVIGEVYLEQGDGETQVRRYIQTLSPQQPLSERLISNAIARLGSDRTITVYLTQGHGERSVEPGQGGLSEVLARLRDENYIVEPLQLTPEGQVPADGDVVIVPGPQQPFLEAEVEALQTFAQGNRGLLLLLDPTAEPGLDPLLDDWGVTLDPNAIILDPEGQSVGLGPAVPLVTRYGPHPITEQLNGMSYFPVAQPVGLTEVPGVEATPILLTGDRAQVQVIDEAGQVELDPEAEQQGTLAVGIAFSRPVRLDPPPTAPEDGPAESRLVVIGNSAFITDGLVNQVLNGDVFLNSVAWLSNQEGDVLAIRPREMTNRRIVLSGLQQGILSIGSLVLVPLLAFAIALALWLKRR